MCLHRELTEIIWKSHKIKDKKKKQMGPKAEILSLLRKRDMTETEIKTEISEDNLRNAITVLRLMLGNKGYRKTLDRRLDGRYYILSEFKKTTSSRILKALVKPMKRSEICEVMPDVTKETVGKILHRLCGNGNYIKKVTRLKTGYYVKVPTEPENDHELLAM